MLNSFFLRIYTANLSRGFRNGPATAWSDAIYMVEFLLTIPLFTFCLFAWVLAMKLKPRTVGALGLPDYVAVILFTGSWLTVHLPVTRVCRRYREPPVTRQSDKPWKDLQFLIWAGLASIGLFALF